MIRDTRHRVALTLGAVLMIAGGLRFFGLGTESLWVDELASVWFSAPPDIGAVISRTAGDVHPPGYYLILHFTTVLLGDAEWAVRLPSAVAGTLAVYVVFLLGRELYSHREGLTGALFTAVFFAPVYYAQEARSYSLLLLFSAITALFWWRSFSRIRGGESPGLWNFLGYVVSAVACCYLHYFGLFLVAFQGASMLSLTVTVWRPRSTLWVFALYVPVVAAYLPWAFVMAGQGRDRDADAPTPALYMEFLFQSPLLILIATLLLGGLFAASLGSVRRTISGRDFEGVLPGAMLVAWAVVPFVVAYIISEFHTPILAARNTIISLPAAYLLLARAVVVLLPTVRWQTAVAVGVAALSLYQILFVDELYSKPHKQQVREAVQFVTQREQDDPLIVHCGIGREANYYYRLQNSDRSNFTQVGACDANRTDAIREAAEGHQEIILVYAHLSPSEQLLEELLSEYRLTRHEDLYDAGAYLYHNPAAG
ncbi:MAG: glycosyltransferase family 39 protein [Rubrobacter sp.]